MQVDIEDLGSPRVIIEFSRRNDVPGNVEYMTTALQALRDGQISYFHPFHTRPAITELTEERKAKIPLLHRSMKPNEVYCINWMSKDFQHWIRFFEQEPDTFTRYRHHFQFAINSEFPNSRLEPGLEVTLEQRFEQLEWLVKFVTENQHKDPNHSITVDIFPMLRYTDLRTGETLDNLGHVRRLFRKLRKLGLTRVHIGFLEPHKKIAKREKHHQIKLIELDTEARKELLRERVFPWSKRYGIRLEVCTARDVLDNENVFLAGCVSLSDIRHIGVGKIIRKRMSGKGGTGSRACICQQTVDVGSYYPACKHGCVYCYANCKKY